MARIRPRKSAVYAGMRPITEYESYSSISKWLKCQTEFVRIYFEHDREAQTLPLIFGQAFHAVVEEALIDKQLGGDSFTVEKAQRRWETRWSIEKDLAMNSKKGLKVDDRSPESWFEQGRALAKIFVEDWLPKIEPRDVEIPFEIKFTDPKIDRTLYGRLDFTEITQKMWDLKTSGRAYRAAKEEYELQSAIYHVAHSTLYHSWPKWVGILRAETSDTPDMEAFDISITPERVQEVFNDTVIPAMRDICVAWKTGIFECSCDKHHKSVDWFEEERKAAEAALAEQAANERILDPEKWEKEHRSELLKAALDLKHVAGDVQPDIIPF